MLHTILDIITNFITPLGAFGVFLAEFLDGLFVFIPSTVIFLVAGFVFLKGPMSWMLLKTMFGVVVLPAAIGLVLGSFIFYIPSYIYGKTFLDKWGRWIGVSWEDVEKLNKRFENTEWDEIGVILARIALIPSVMVTVYCGVIRIPPKRYAVITFIGGFFKALSIALIGWSAGELYVKYAEVIDKAEQGLLGLIVLALAAFVVYRKRERHKSTNAHE